MPHLTGCVKDTEDIRLICSESLRVPDSRMSSIADEKATREEIVKAVMGLRDDPRIRPYDSILIYFAGYGGLDPSDIETIIPYDDWRK
jgi:Caspase domain